MQCCCRILATAIAVFMIAANTANAQEKSVANANQQWVQYYAQLKLNGPWALLADGGYRWKDGFEASTQYIARMGVGYSVKPGVRLAAGLAHLGFYTNGALDRIEFRPYQEVLLKRKMASLSLTHRYRIEERFFNYVNSRSETPNSFNIRFRYSIMVAIPLFKLSKAKDDKAVVLNIGNELFISAGQDIVHNVFNQNRLIISPSLKMSDQFTVSFTWNHQFASTSTPGQYVQTTVMWLQLKHKLNLENK